MISLPHFKIPPLRAHPLVRGGHAQTIVGAYWPHPITLAGTKHHHVALDDGDRIVLHDDVPAGWSPGNRVVLLLHGLGGCYQSPYVQRMAMKLVARGLRAVRLDMRGCGAGYALARGPAHAGRSGDALAAVEFLSRLCPGSPLTIVGYSLGGNITLKMLGECSSHPPGHLDSAIAVCPPADLASCARNMERGLNWVYDRSFINTLNALVKRRRRELPHFEDGEALSPWPRKLADFDHRYTAPRSGFASVEDYYAKASSAPLLASIDVPTLLLTAADDPIIPAEQFTRHKLSSAVHLHIAETGGHLGFLSVRTSDADRRWLDWRLLEWLDRL